MVRTTRRARFRLYPGFHRVLRPGDLRATQEPMAGPVHPVIVPVMWARDESINFRAAEEGLRGHRHP